uniref:Uncharacterized protein n=1 Tax=Bos mutus grunniens TaxID=30521 RepID=A0A8B9WNP2_BOSMU
RFYIHKSSSFYHCCCALKTTYISTRSGQQSLLRPRFGACVGCSEHTQQSTSRKDRLERLSPMVLSEVAAILPHTQGIQLLGWGNPRGEWREPARPTDRSLSRV